MILDDINMISIVQVGCGGTGGYLVPKVARLLMTLASFKKEVRVIYTINDFDFVEEKNLYRQNFIQGDLGKNKADVCALRYGSHFEVNIISCSEKKENSDQLKNLFSLRANDGMCWSPKVLCILIGAVDNNKARKVMHDLFHNWNGFGYGHSLVYIDGGNGKFTGQVVTGYRTPKEIILPPVGDVFPEALIEDEQEQPQNCALNALQNPQNIGANDMAATLIFSIVNVLLTDNEINSHIINFDGKTQEISTRGNKEIAEGGELNAIDSGLCLR